MTSNLNTEIWQLKGIFFINIKHSLLEDRFNLKIPGNLSHWQRYKDNIKSICTFSFLLIYTWKGKMVLTINPLEKKKKELSIPLEKGSWNLIKHCLYANQRRCSLLMPPGELASRFRTSCSHDSWLRSMVMTGQLNS